MDKLKKDYINCFNAFKYYFLKKELFLPENFDVFIKWYSEYYKIDDLSKIKGFEIEDFARYHKCIAENKRTTL